MEKIVLIGGGGHCKSVIDTILNLNKYDDIVITDINENIGKKILGIPIVGDDSILPKLYSEGYKNAFITMAGISTAKIRRRIFQNLINIGFSIPTIIDATATVSNFSEIGMGVFVGKNAVINSDCKIGNVVVINTKALIEHECIVGDFSHVSVGSVLCGQVKIRENVFVGANATIIQGITVDDDVLIGAGSLLLNDVSKNCTVKGVFHE